MKYNLKELNKIMGHCKNNCSEEDKKYLDNRNRKISVLNLGEKWGKIIIVYYYKEYFYDELLPFINDRKKFLEIKATRDSHLLWETLEQLNKQYLKDKEEEAKHRTEVRHKRNKYKEQYNVSPKELKKIIKILQIQYLKSLNVSNKTICTILNINKSTVSKYSKLKYEGNLVLSKSEKEKLKSFLK